MAISKKVHEALIQQIGREFGAHFLYRSIAMDLYHKGFQGISAWMEQHATEEYGHAERIIAYLKEHDAKVTLPAVAQPVDTFAGVREAVAAALGHEKKLTADIHALHRLADEENDPATVSMLEWFVDEQVEEEHTVNSLLKRIDLSGPSDIGLFVIDSEMRGNAAAATAAGAE